MTDDHVGVASDERPRIVAEIDDRHFAILRASVSTALSEFARDFDGPAVRVLDIAPQDHEGAAAHFTRALVDTLDIDPAAGATYTADLCSDFSGVVGDAAYDVVVCTEVLEHTLNPFAAVAQIRRVLRPGGQALVTTPFNFRIHGPLPDCWRFTEYGLRALLADFEIVDLTAVEDPDRFLMPIHYRTRVRVPQALGAPVR